MVAENYETNQEYGMVWCGSDTCKGSGFLSSEEKLARHLSSKGCKTLDNYAKMKKVDVARLRQGLPVRGRAQKLTAEGEILLKDLMRDLKDADFMKKFNNENDGIVAPKNAGKRPLRTSRRTPAKRQK